jgi:hypothetical protein
LDLSNDYYAYHVIQVHNIRTDNGAFFMIAKDSAHRFFAVRLTSPGEGYLGASMRRGLWLFLTLAAGLSGTPGIAGGSALADDANPGKAAPAIGGSPSSAESIDAGGSAGSWRLVRSPAATAETGEAAILHTADIERSDPRLAGLMLRCGTQGIEAVIVVVEPFPPQARPQIILRTPRQESQFIGTIIPTGAGIRLPGEAKSLVTGPWQTARELEIKVADGGAHVDGVVALTGLPKALQSLNAECIQK